MRHLAVSAMRLARNPLVAHSHHWLLNLGFYHIFLFGAPSNEGIYGVVNQNLMSAVIMPKTSTPPVLRIA